MPAISANTAWRINWRTGVSVPSPAISRSSNSSGVMSSR
jgi:hypothetical protein